MKSKLIIRKENFLQVNPKKIINYKKGDPTWKLENKYFINKVKSKSKTSLKKDILINTSLNKLI